MATYILTSSYMPGRYWPGLYWPITADPLVACPPYQVRGEAWDIDLAVSARVVAEQSAAALYPSEESTVVRVVEINGAVRVIEVSLTIPMDCTPA